MRRTSSSDPHYKSSFKGRQLLIIRAVIVALGYSPSPRGSNVWIISWKMVFLMVLLCKEAELPPRWRDGFTWGKTWLRSRLPLTVTDSDSSMSDNHVIVKVRLVSFPEKCIYMCPHLKGGMLTWCYEGTVERSIWCKITCKWMNTECAGYKDVVFCVFLFAVDWLVDFYLQPILVLWSRRGIIFIVLICLHATMFFSVIIIHSKLFQSGKA